MTSRLERIFSNKLLKEYLNTKARKKPAKTKGVDSDKKKMTKSENAASKEYDKDVIMNEQEISVEKLMNEWFDMLDHFKYLN